MVWQGIPNFRTKSSETFCAKPYLIDFRHTHKKKGRLYDSVACLEPFQISMLKRFGEIVNGLKPLSIFEKRALKDVWQGPKYASVTVRKC